MRSLFSGASRILIGVKQSRYHRALPHPDAIAYHHRGKGMDDKIRLGFVGANVRSAWASQSHFPALLASPDVELTAVCTTRPETAEEARKAFGAQLAFHDFRAMVASPEIDAVAVV